ncbi:carboxymuconolactone decarboxylase family protein [mine drainage metagenome]|uniref:Carboxymuconolactone decarboxylase family protein n=1 Tax=mine drainage metagenome TaxID=410659 RepID=A0A1J5QBQ5_9ZZZZ
MSSAESHAQRVLGQDAHKLAQLTDEVLFGDVWERAELSKRHRSMVTVAALVAMYRLEQLPFHLARALEHGVTKKELVEIITHLAFYSGWPTAASAMQLLNATMSPDGRVDQDSRA